MARRAGFHLWRTGRSANTRLTATTVATAALLVVAVPAAVGAEASPAQTRPSLPNPAASPGPRAAAAAQAVAAVSSPASTTTPLLDDFNRPNEDPLSQGGAWSPRDPRGGCCADVLSVVSNAAQNTRTAGGAISYRLQNFPLDIELYATVAAKPMDGRSVALIFSLRQEGGASTWDGYYLDWAAKAGADEFRIHRCENNSICTIVAGPIPLEYSAGDKLMVRRIGPVIEGWAFQSGTWSNKLSFQDPGGWTGTKVGLHIGGGSAGGRIDDFGGGAFVPPDPPPLAQSTGTCGVGVHAYSRSACRQGVNTLTGAFTTRAVDLRLGGIGIPLALTRTYSSNANAISALGPGWTNGFGTSLFPEDAGAARRAGAAAATLAAGDVTVLGEDGQQIVFRKQQNGTYVGDRGTLSVLSAVPTGGFKLVRHDQAIYTFDDVGELTSMKDSNGQGLTLAYDSFGNLQTITDSVGRQITVAHVGGRLTRVTLPDGRYVEYGYTNGLLTSVKDARGGTTVYAYDSAGRLETVVDQRGKAIVRNGYDETTGRVDEQFDALNNRTQFAWDEATDTTTMTDARGNAWKDKYIGNVIAERANPHQQRTVFQHNLQLDVIKVTDARGNSTEMTYDDRGNMLTGKPPTPFTFQEVWTYTAHNDVDTYRDGRGNLTDYGYDGAGNLTSITQPDPDPSTPAGAVWTYERDPATALVTSITDPRGKTTFFAYTNGDLTEIRTHLGHRTTMTYDESGRMETRIDPRGNAAGANPSDFTWSYEYDANDQLDLLTDPLGHVTDPEYDPAGNLESTTDANGRTTTYVNDDAGRLQTITAPDPTEDGLPAPVTQYGYDAVGNLERVTDAEGRVTTYGYDAANRLERTTAPDNRIWTYLYDADGNLDRVVDANGNATPTEGDGLTNYDHDELNRLKLVDYSDTTPDVTFTYDPNGNRTQMTDGSGTETYTYDAVNNLKTVTRGSTTFSYSHDDASNRKQTTYPDSTAVSATYDDDGRLETVASGGLTTSYAYDAGANLRTVTLPSANGHVETRLYDRAGRLSEVKHQKGQTVLNSATYTLDPVGNPEQIVRSTGTETYRYDALDRLIEVCFQAGCPGSEFIRWTYDRVGNRLTEVRPAGTTAYDYNDADELEQAGSTTYVHDKNGNQKTAGTRTFDYDLANHLKSTTSGSSTVTYVYDGTGKRLETVGEGTPAAPTLKTPCPTAIGSSGSAVVSKPSSTVVGDLLIVGLAFEKGSDSAITPPSGWTLIRRTNQSSNVGYATYRKAAGASEPASYAFALTNSPKWSIGACAISGAHATSPIDDSNAAAASSGHPSAPSVTTSGPSRLVLAFYANKKPATFSNYTAPATERWDAPNGPGGLPSNALAFYERPTAGATGAKSATASEAAEWVAQQIAIAPGTPVTKFLWDVNHALPQVALERNASNELVRRYVYGAGRISQTAGTSTSYFHHDGLGSVVNLTSDTGATQRTMSYEPFGAVRTNTGSGASTVHKFAGEYEDGTGLYHLRARQYDPTTGRFLSRDPVPSMGSAYAYAANNPLVYIDPLGLLPGWVSDLGHATLDVVGLVPVFGEPADLINCGWYAAEGDKLNAGLSCGSAVPIGGYLASGIKFGRRGVNAVADGRKVADSVQPAAKPIAVIGRQGDTAIAKEWPGHEVLDLPGDTWTLAKNDEWVASVIARRMDVDVASPTTWDNLWNTARGRQRPFGRELDQFMDAGYTWDGWTLRAPRP